MLECYQPIQQTSSKDHLVSLFNNGRVAVLNTFWSSAEIQWFDSVEEAREKFEGFQNVDIQSLDDKITRDVGRDALKALSKL